MSGTVTERSVMFLGGQDGPPSIGGRFDLHDATAAAAYRITIPTTELKTKLRREVISAFGIHHRLRRHASPLCC